MIWNSREDGYSLKGLYLKCEEYRDEEMLVIFRSCNNAVFFLNKIKK